jgi:hypothetical protein
VCSSKLVSSKVDRAGILCYSSDIREEIRVAGENLWIWCLANSNALLAWTDEKLNNCIDLTLEKVEDKIQRKYGDDIGHKVRLLFIISPEFFLIPNLGKIFFLKLRQKQLTQFTALSVDSLKTRGAENVSWHGHFNVKLKNTRRTSQHLKRRQPDKGRCSPCVLQVVLSLSIHSFHINYWHYLHWHRSLKIISVYSL